ncbi:MAG: 23S rRNA (uracil(1939)-C(5))-methyltransferase RlmD, partial [Myxococcales bacterium FL481]
MRARKRRRRAPSEPREATVEGLSREGLGWWNTSTERTDDAVTVIERRVEAFDVLPGERLSFREVDRHRGVGRGEVLELRERSEDRVEPTCPHVGLCGGCSLQHMASRAQVEHKQAQLLADFTTIGGVEPARILAPIRGPLFGYRRRARLGIKDVPAKGKVLVGFRERDKRFVADLSRCPVLREPANNLLAPLSTCIASLSISRRVPQAEVSVADNAVALVLRVLDPPSDDDRAALAAFGRDQGVVVFLQPGGPQTVQPLETAPPLRYRLARHDIEFDFEPLDFVQVNAEVNEQLVDLALDQLQLAPHHRVLDAFCGLGNFSLPLARRVGHVCGLEGDAGLIARARANASKHGLDNVEFDAVDLHRECESHPRLSTTYDRVLLDPPRSGAARIVAHMGQLRPERIVYVACSPESLARDAGELVRHQGYALEAAGVIDMFLHTAHVESIAVFVRTST